MSHANKTPRILITMGDPAGIGPEICVKALADRDVYGVCRPVVVGDAAVLQRAVETAGARVVLKPIGDISHAVFETGNVDVLDLKNVDLALVEWGKVSAAAGKAAFEYVRAGVELAMSGAADAIVTGPINKEAINMAGYHYAGHTEILAEFTGSRDYAMMLVDGGLRVVHTSTHVSLREACDRVKRGRVLIVIQLAHQAAKDLGITCPRVGVAGLNPHAGEGGLFGTEEIEEIIPAIDDARALGIDAVGPVPPDSLFAKARGGHFDIVVAMYHDQGHIPVKTVGFELDEATGLAKAVRGVNVTLGLPIVRTSVDHGTAFEIAGTGKANHESMKEAVLMAVCLVQGRLSGR